MDVDMKGALTMILPLLRFFLSSLCFSHPLNTRLFVPF